MTTRADLPARAKKAARLLNENRVHEIEGRVFVVRGDNGTYLVTVAPEARAGTGLSPATRSCTCEAGLHQREASCSHVLTAEMWLTREKFKDNPLQGIGANH